MISTTLAVLALAGGFSPSSTSWQTDYARAMAAASAGNKPMAVFIGRGAETPGRMLADGTIPSEAASLLREKFVWTYVDTDTAAGRELAGQFELANGLVISGPGGKVQAYRTTATVAGTDLTQRLTQYASAGQPTTTVVAQGPVATGPVVGATAYPAGVSPVMLSGGCPGGNCGVSPVMLSGGCPGGNCGGVIQSGYGFPAYQPFPVGGGCPNGRCPNQR